MRQFGDLGPKTGPLGVREGLVPPELGDIPNRHPHTRQWKISPHEKGIADISILGTQQLGRKANLSGPPTVFDNVAGVSTLWGGVNGDPLGGDPTTFKLPFNSTQATLLQANAENTANPQQLLINLDAPFFPTNTDRSVDLKALLIWGNGDDLSKALVDVRTGCQISLVGTNLQIDGIYTALTGAPGGFPDINVGASFGYGSRSSQDGMPTFTQRAFNVGPGQRVLRVPNYATEVTFYNQDQVTGLSVAADYVLLDNPAGLAFTRFTVAANVIQTVTLPSITRAIQIINGGANAVNTTLVYSLAL